MKSEKEIRLSVIKALQVKLGSSPICPVCRAECGFELKRNTQIIDDEDYVITHCNNCGFVVSHHLESLLSNI